MNFKIFKVDNGFLLTVVYSRQKAESFIYKPTERMTMLAKIDQLLGPEPTDSVGMGTVK